MDIAARNRAIKKTLEQAFGKGKVRVRGSRGTGYGWASVRIDYTPRDIEEARELQTQCRRLLRAANIDLGMWYTDDGRTLDQCNISFNYDNL